MCPVLKVCLLIRTSLAVLVRIIIILLARYWVYITIIESLFIDKNITRFARSESFFSFACYYIVIFLISNPMVFFAIFYDHI